MRFQAKDTAIYSFFLGCMNFLESWKPALSYPEIMTFVLPSEVFLKSACFKKNIHNILDGGRRHITTIFYEKRWYVTNIQVILLEEFPGARILWHGATCNPKNIEKWMALTSSCCQKSLNTFGLGIHPSFQLQPHWRKQHKGWGVALGNQFTTPKKGLTEYKVSTRCCLLRSYNIGR